MVIAPRTTPQDGGRSDHPLLHSINWNSGNISDGPEQVLDAFRAGRSPEQLRRGGALLGDRRPAEGGEEYAADEGIGVAAVPARSSAGPPCLSLSSRVTPLVSSRAWSVVAIGVAAGDDLLPACPPEGGESRGRRRPAPPGAESHRRPARASGRPRPPGPPRPVEPAAGRAARPRAASRRCHRAGSSSRPSASSAQSQVASVPTPQACRPSLNPPTQAIKAAGFGLRTSMPLAVLRGRASWSPRPR